MRLTRKTVKPAAKMLIAIPLTIWSARNWIETTAWIDAISPPAMIATTVASHALCQARSATTAKKAPVSIMPSIAMFTTPLRSEMTPPRAGSSSRTAAARTACQRLAVNRRWPMSPSTLMWVPGAGRPIPTSNPQQAEARVEGRPICDRRASLCESPRQSSRRC